MMRAVAFFLLAALAGCTRFDGDRSIEWKHRLDTVRFASPVDVAAMEDGAYLLANQGGYTSDGTGNTQPPVTADLLVATVDGDGRVLWNKSIDLGGNEQGVTVVASSDGGALLLGSRLEGNFPAPVAAIVVALDSTGRQRWTLDLSDLRVEPTMHANLAATSDGGCVVAGFIIDDANYDAIVVGVDGSGKRRWTRRIGREDRDEYARSIAVESEGTIVVACASVRRTSPKRGDLLLLCLAPDGSTRWEKRMALDNDQVAAHIVAIDNGYIVDAGTRYHGDTADGHCLMRVDRDGTRRWTRSYLSFYDPVVDILSDGDKALLISERSSMTIDGDGTMEWAGSFPSDADSPIAVDRDANGTLVVVANAVIDTYAQGVVYGGR